MRWNGGGRRPKILFLITWSHHEFNYPLDMWSFIVKNQVRFLSHVIKRVFFLLSRTSVYAGCRTYDSGFGFAKKRTNHRCCCELGMFEHVLLSRLDKLPPRLPDQLQDGVGTIVVLQAYIMSQLDADVSTGNLYIGASCHQCWTRSTVPLIY